ncbi:MAG: hypothetical protein KatS3mg038_0487 [Candidatus Kapaibacterium sp.]|nr:MAG: hypothetical protein KatS3mg038_0487 [Candidatus Kapabacteria bacterium]
MHTAVDVVIIHHNTLELTRRCIASLLESPQRMLIASITLVDNASTDSSGEILAARYPVITVRRLERPHSYAAACNIGALAGSARYVLLSNSDVEFDPNVLQVCVTHMERFPNVGVCAGNQRYPDQRPQRSWGYFPGWGEIAATIGGIEFLHNWRGHRQRQWRAVPYCDGAALFCRRSAYEQLGGMDERFSFFAEDADLCYRMWQHGWHCHFLPEASIVHHRGGTRRRTFEQAIASERRNIAAKLQFVRFHHPRSEYVVALGYWLALQLGSMFDRIRYSMGAYSQHEWEFRTRIRRELVAFLAERL